MLGTGSIAASVTSSTAATFDISATTSGLLDQDAVGHRRDVTLGAQTLTLSNASTTFGGAIDGSGGLTLTAGTETLTGDNLYTGATTINGGTLALSGSGSIAASSDVIDDSTFDISATTAGASIVTLSGTGNVTLGAQTLTLSNASTTFGRADRRRLRRADVDGRHRDADRRQSLARRDHDQRRHAEAVGHRLDRGLQRCHRRRHLRYLGDLGRFDQDSVGHRR